MKLFLAAAYLLSILSCHSVDAQGSLVKMCLFYDSPSGHVRSDPIIDQQCASDHVHTFYGPQNFHPKTTNEDLLATSALESSTPFIENQSLYWHPTIYEVSKNSDGTNTYTRAPIESTGPYYRWDNSVKPKTEAFPPGFKMIAHSDDERANLGGETGENLLVECCNGDEECTTTSVMKFPEKNCDFLGLAFAMPTCWDGRPDSPNHKRHMAYTMDGTVAGKCPSGYDRRLPQVQLFIRISPYKGKSVKYTLSDEKRVFHIDFMNGWKEGKLEEIIEDCPVPEQEEGDYNPECGCVDKFLTPNPNPSGAICDGDVREHIIDEATDIVDKLPRGSCKGPTLKTKSWTGGDLPFTCSVKPEPSSDSEDEGEQCEGCKALLGALERNKKVAKTCNKTCAKLIKKRSFEGVDKTTCSAICGGSAAVNNEICKALNFCENEDGDSNEEDGDSNEEDENEDNDSNEED